jgi:hypothetical protein
MAWFAYLFWGCAIFLCLYVAIEINQSKKNTDKVRQIQEEMTRLEQIEQLTGEMELARDRMISRFKYFREQLMNLPETVELYTTRILQILARVVMDVLGSRIFYIIG